MGGVLTPSIIIGQDGNFLRHFALVALADNLEDFFVVMLAIFKRKELNDLKAAINKLEKSKSKSKEVGALKKIYNMISSNPGTTFGTGVALLVSTLVANGDIRFQDLNSITDLVKLKKKKKYRPMDAEEFHAKLKAEMEKSEKERMERT